MNKIMFSDEFMLTKAVLEGRKTQTRRMITYPKKFHGKDVWGYYVYRRATDGAITEICMYDEDEISIDEGQILPKYKVGEVVAVAQSYCFIAEELENCNNATCVAHYEKNVQKASEYISWMEHPGFNNKMFVAADMMIHRIRITDVRVERLQDISGNDCLKEGVRKVVNENGIYILNPGSTSCPRDGNPPCGNERFHTPRGREEKSRSEKDTSWRDTHHAPRLLGRNSY